MDKSISCRYTAVVIFLGVLVILQGDGNVFTQNANMSPQNELRVRENPQTTLADALATIKDEDLRKTDPQKLADAIRVLGDRRIEGAVNDLIKYMDFRLWHKWELPGSDVKDIDVLIPKNGDYPAVDALFEIGEPALSSLVKVIEEHKINSIESRNALETIRLIFRDNISDGINYLAISVTTSTSAEGRKRLKQCEMTLRSELQHSNAGLSRPNQGFLSSGGIFWGQGLHGQRRNSKAELTISTPNGKAKEEHLCTYRFP